MKYVKYAFALLVLAGFAFAIQPAEAWTVGATGKYIPVTQATYTTEGGNVTEGNLSGNISTEKWAGLWGNVTGEIVLSPDNVDMFYTWAWDSGEGGEVCATVGTTFDWTTPVAITTGNLDNMWNFNTGEADDAASTLTSAACNLDLGGIPITSIGNLTGVGGFETCAIADVVPPVNKADVAFCVNITQNGNLFNGQTGDYELLVATNETITGTETYNFWLEFA